MRQLQENVSQWKQSYDQLMEEWRNLSLEKVVEEEESVKNVRFRGADPNVCGYSLSVCVNPKPLPPQEVRQEVRRLESELAEHQKLLTRTDATNQHLLKEVNSLRKERGMSVLELSTVSSQMDSLNRTNQLGRLAEEDLHHVLHLIDTGIKEGILKVGVALVGVVGWGDVIDQRVWGVALLGEDDGVWSNAIG